MFSLLRLQLFCHRFLRVTASELTEIFREKQFLLCTENAQLTLIYNSRICKIKRFGFESSPNFIGEVRKQDSNKNPNPKFAHLSTNHWTLYSVVTCPVKEKRYISNILTICAKACGIS